MKNCWYSKKLNLLPTYTIYVLSYKVIGTIRELITKYLAKENLVS